MNNNNSIIEEKILNFLKKHNLLEKKQILFVGFSGGIDSACLLDMLSKLSQENGFKLIAGHLNHNWRGEESKKEELRAKEFCKKRNIEFYSETLPDCLPQSEEEARKQRYKFFNKIAAKTKSTAILTGHTLSDQVETVLYRIIKGTGISGLKGIPEVRHQAGFPSIYRPMIEITREETTHYCKENNINPNIDSSNDNKKYLRNRIRLKLIPKLKLYNLGIENAILRLSSIAKNSEEITEEYLHIVNNAIYEENNVISTKLFLVLSSGVQKRILFEFFIKNNIEYNYEKIEENLYFIKKSECLKSGNTNSLGKDLWLFASSAEIKIINNIKAPKILNIKEIRPDEEINFSELSFTVKINKWEKDKPKRFPKETDKNAYVDLSGIKPPFFLRTRRSGDIIQPFGMDEKTKLKKYLINKGIPEHERDKLLIFANKEEVLWVIGVGISELLKVKNIPTHEINIIQNL